MCPAVQNRAGEERWWGGLRTRAASPNVLVQSSKESENSKLESGLPSNYEGTVCQGKKHET